MERRRILKGAAAALGLAGLRDALGTVGSMAELGFTEIPDGALAEQLLHALPGKVLLIKKSFRPPNYETPIEYFRTPMTANRAFFVRWHLAAIPQVALKDWKLAVGGESAERQLNFTMSELLRLVSRPAARPTPREAEGDDDQQHQREAEGSVELPALELIVIEVHLAVGRELQLGTGRLVAPAPPQLAGDVDGPAGRQQDGDGEPQLLLGRCCKDHRFSSGHGWPLLRPQVVGACGAEPALPVGESS